MYNGNNGANMEAVESKCGCAPNRRTITDNAREIGKMLEEAKLVISDMGTQLFGDEKIEGERPVAKCLEHEMEINTAAMESLLCGLKCMKDRLL